MTICRITRLSSATRIFTGTPTSVMRGWWWMGGTSVRHRQGRESALHGDRDRLAPPEDVDADDVGGVPDGRRVADLWKAERGRAGEGGLDVAPHDVGDLAESVGDVLVLEQFGRVVPEQRPGEVRRGLGAG